MFKARHLLLIEKASAYIERINSNEYTPDGKATSALLYQIDALTYGLAGIDSAVWRTFLKTFRETKNLLRVHSRNEDIKKENYSLATGMVVQTLDKYVVYLKSTLEPEIEI